MENLSKSQCKRFKTLLIAIFSISVEGLHIKMNADDLVRSLFFGVSPRFSAVDRAVPDQNQKMKLLIVAMQEIENARLQKPSRTSLCRNNPHQKFTLTLET